MWYFLDSLTFITFFSFTNVQPALPMEATIELLFTNKVAQSAAESVVLKIFLVGIFCLKIIWTEKRIFFHLWCRACIVCQPCADRVDIVDRGTVFYQITVCRPCLHCRPCVDRGTLFYQITVCIQCLHCRPCVDRGTLFYQITECSMKPPWRLGGF